jgi:TonB-like protein
MNKNWLLLLPMTASLTLVACASGPRPLAISPACADMSDSVAKYVSVDALPFAHLIGTPRVLPVPPTLRRGDSIAVEFVVRPDGVADPSSVQITGSNDQAFARNVLRFVTESRFTPATVTGCNVLSKYNLIIKPAA